VLPGEKVPIPPDLIWKIRGQTTLFNPLIVCKGVFRCLPPEAHLSTRLEKSVLEEEAR
jgi:hypothetical protein